MAYNNVTYKIKEMHELNDHITKKDIPLLDITVNMKEKLIALLSKKISKKDTQMIKENKLRQELINVAGIGKTKALELIKLGLTDVKQLTQKKWAPYLNTDTLVLLKYKPLLNIPNLFIKKIEKELTGFKGATVVGGFLRKKPFSKDIDVMIVSNTDILNSYVEYLKTKFKDVVVYSKGSDKMSLVIAPSRKYYKVDIFRSRVSQQYAMLLYSTGSKRFNIKMRGIAKRKGYLLNQMGLFKLPCKKGDNPIPVRSEKNISKILDMPYVKPEHR